MLPGGDKVQSERHTESKAQRHKGKIKANTCSFCKFFNFVPLCLSASVSV